jgi:hypothetical protein
MRFSIRDMLWATTLVAVSAAWWLDHRKCRQWYYDVMMWQDTAQSLADEYMAKTGFQPITKINGEHWKPSGMFFDDPGPGKPLPTIPNAPK